MKNKWIGRSPALIGVIFPVFGFIRGGGDDSAPTASSSGAQIAAYAYHHGLPNSLYYLELGAFLALMVFSIVLYSRLRSTEPGGAIAAKVVVAACVVSVAIKLSSFPAVYALYSSPVLLDPGVARALWMLGEFAFTVSMLSQALSLGAVAVSGLISGGIPRWLAATAGVIAVSIGVGVVLGGNFEVAPTLAWFLWLLVASVTLFVQSPRTSGQEQPAQRGFAASAV